MEERWRKGGGKEEKKKREGKRKARATAEPWRFYTSGFVASLNALYVYFCSIGLLPPEGSFATLCACSMGSSRVISVHKNETGQVAKHLGG